ncbi:MAG: hypothetical protein ACK4S0_12985 [Sediminibacterium sp.]
MQIVFNSTQMNYNRKSICHFIVILVGFFSIYSCKAPAKVIASGVGKNSIKDTLVDSSRLSVYKGDTLGYLNYLVNNQEKYKGKPLSYFLSECELSIKRFSYWPNSKDRNKIYNIELSANEIGQASTIGKNGEVGYIEIGIRWQTYVPYDSIQLIYDFNGPPDRGRWSQMAKEYFGRQIVGNLWLNYYMKRK